MRINEAETSRKLFQAVSVFCFSSISECVTSFYCVVVLARVWVWCYATFCFRVKLIINCSG